MSIKNEMNQAVFLSTAFEDSQTTPSDVHIVGNWLEWCNPFQVSPHELRGPESPAELPLVSTRGGRNCTTHDEAN